MDIVVLVKQVPDTGAPIRLVEDGSRIAGDDLKMVLNPYDEYAVEEALRLKEQAGGAVTVVTAGPEGAVEALRTALAMGADEAVHLLDPALAGGDTVTIGRALAAAVAQLPHDLILCGKQAVDDEVGGVGAAVAHFLGIGQALGVTKLEVEGGGFVAERPVEGGTEIVAGSLPAVVSCAKGLNEPRYASLPGMMRAKRKEVAVKTVADLGLDPATVGAAGAGTARLELAYPPAHSAGRVAGDAAELVALLRAAKAL